MTMNDKFIHSVKYIPSDFERNRKIEIFVNKKRGRDTEYDYSDEHINVTQSNKRIKIEVKLKKPKFNSLDFGYRLLRHIKNKKNIITDIIEIYGANSPSKELSESACVYKQICNLFKDKFSVDYFHKLCDRSDIICLNVADGINPKTGHIFAGMTNWKVMSIDPLMKDIWIKDSRHSNLVCIKSLIEDVDLTCVEEYSLVFIIAIHSHANIDKLWNTLLQYKTPIICLSVPCCGGYVHKVEDVIPIKDIHDDSMLSDRPSVIRSRKRSDMNNVIIWTNYDKLLPCE